MTDYLDCMRIRYGNDLRYTVAIPSSMLRLQIPKLCLQLLVENSIKFATSSVRPPWLIHIEGTQTDQQWRISIHDNGNGFSPEKLDELNAQIDSIDKTGLLPSLELHGMGLLNIYIRFKLLYHGQHYFCVENAADGGALVTIGGNLDV